MRKIFGILSLIFCFSLCPCWGGEIQAVIFDFGGVIATVDRDLVTDFVAGSFGVSRDRALELIAKWQERQQKGEDEYKFLQRDAHSHGLSSRESRFWLREWDRVNAIAFKEIPGMLDLVRGLQKRGFVTALFSNMTSSQERRVAKAGYLDYFDPLFLSHLLKVEKPDLKAYQRVIKKLALPPGSCLFVDDKLENVQAAKECGMDAILFTDPAQLVEDFQQRGIEVRVRSIRKAQHVPS